MDYLEIQKIDDKYIILFILSISLLIWTKFVLTYNLSGGDWVTVIYGNSNIEKVFFSSYSNDLFFNKPAYYRPLVSLIIFSGYKLFGLEPLGYQIINLFIFIINVSLFYLFCRKVKDKKTSILASLMFLVHPIFLITIPQLEKMPDLLSLTFLLSILLSLDKIAENRDRWLFVVGSLSFLGYLSKESFIAIIPIVLLYVKFIQRKDNIKKITFALLTPFLIYLVGRVYVLGEIGGAWSAENINLRSMIIERLALVGLMVKNILYPVEITPYIYSLDLFVIERAIVAIIIMAIVLIYLTKKIGINTLKMEPFKEVSNLQIFLFGWIISYSSLYFIYGIFKIWYVVPVLPPLYIILSSELLSNQKNLGNKIKKFLIVVFIIYTVFLSPLVQSHDNLKKETGLRMMEIEKMNEINDEIRNGPVYLLYFGNKYTLYNPKLLAYDGEAFLKLKSENLEVEREDIKIEMEKNFSYRINKKKDKKAIEIKTNQNITEKYKDKEKDDNPITIKGSKIIIEKYKENGKIVIVQIGSESKTLKMKLVDIQKLD